MSMGHAFISGVFLNFFLQWGVVFRVQVFYLLGEVYSLVLYFSCCCIKWDFIFPDVSWLVYRNASNFWALTLYQAVLPNSLIRSSRLCGVCGIFGIHSHVICKTMAVLFPPLEFGGRLCVVLVSLLWLGLPILCSIGTVKAGIPVLFLIFVGKL